jgi:phosphonate degradation associated HDIG domain protein
MASQQQSDILDRIETLFQERGADDYHGEAVTQLEHALQAAMAAEAEGATATLVAAALLHDIGHLLQRHGDHAAEQGIDDRHEDLGERFLARYFGPAVAEPVRLHVAAKRYLCAVDPAYAQALSPASRLSLQLQGGPMSSAERTEFESHPHYADAVRLRRWDDRAKVPGLSTPVLSHYRETLESCTAIANKPVHNMFMVDSRPQTTDPS